jgi:hypothetical protein
MNILNRLRSLAQQSLFWVELDLILRGQDPKDYVVQNDRTQICIEGYRRSANSFSVRMFRMANNGVHVAHHTHSTANIGRALRYGIPTVVLIRNPVDAITSAVIAQARGDIDDEVCRYLKFYHWVEPRVDAVVIAEFQTVVTDFNQVIHRVNEKYNTAFKCIENLELAEKDVRQAMRDRLASRGKHDRGLRWLGRSILPDAVMPVEAQEDTRLRWLPIPDAERETAKTELRPLISKHRQVAEAQALYARLSGRDQVGDPC